MGAPVIVGLGEILWDVFPDGPRFGGAPSNFACSAAELAQQTARVFMVSAVGDDDLGAKAVDSLRRHGVDTRCVQTNAFETGQVHVEVDQAGIASYRFASDSAWDHLQWNQELSSLAGECDAVCFGTLGQRGDQSRAAIREFVGAVPGDALRILDVNLRSPYYDATLIRDSLDIANVLKLNEEELQFLAKQFQYEGGRIDALRRLAEQFELRALALTLGGDGAVLMVEDAISEMPGQRVEVADTVGAGDAFTAAMTLGLLKRAPVERVNQGAIMAASHVCSRSGATMRFPAGLVEGSF